MIGVHDQNLILESFIGLRCPVLDLSVEFYIHLFRDNPDLIPLFPEDIGHQAAKFAALLDWVMLSIDQLDECHESLVWLGEVHGRKGIGVRHFDPIIDAIILALSENVAGWEPAYEATWRRSLHEISEIMREGFEKVAAEATASSAA